MKLPDRYKPLSSPMAGGFGSVIPLQDTFLRRVVLLKIMQDKANNAQLQNEINGLSKARSRHVVEIYDVLRDEKSDINGIIIERLRGREFSKFHEQAFTNPNDFLKILYQIATALKDIHAVGIVHRDLKLDNFKESSSGVVKIFDFGISSPDSGYQTKENKGTLVYAAPELYVAGATITPEMDIYAFGACAWALASPKFPPVLKETPPQQSALCPSISTVMPTYPSHVDGLHAEVVALLDACLNPNPGSRPTAETLSSVLGRHLVRNRHRGLFIQGKTKVVELSTAQPSVNLKIGGLGEISVAYDGLAFIVTQVSGSVRINNVPIAAGQVLHQACLLSFGDSSLGSGQQWVTFFASHPEVVL